MSLALKNVTETMCGIPQRNKTKTVSIIGMVGISLAMIAFVLRLLARTMHHQIGIDDWAMIVAMVLAKQPQSSFDRADNYRAL